jgi:hypothetical protein
MRRRRQRFIPIFLIALVVQILAPIAASWAAAIAASDPLGVAEICHANPGGPAVPGDPGADHRAGDGFCLICSAAQAGAALDAPQLMAVAIPHREPDPALWPDGAMEFFATRVSSTAQARAPPQPA